MARTAKLNRLTDLEVKRYVKGTETALLADGGGLYLRRLRSGCYWYLKTTSPESGRTVWYSLFADDMQATAPGKTLADARAKAKELWAQQAQRIEPRAERERQDRARRLKDAAEQAAEQAAQRRLTVKKLFEQWQRVELKPQVLADGTRTGRKDGGQWVRDSFERRVFGALGDVPAADVRKADLLAILDEAKASGARRTANVLLADLKQMFRFAADREIVLRNPLDGIRRATIGGKDVERDRNLSAAELRALWAAMPGAKMGRRSAAAVWLILSTACRVGEAMNAQWQHVDLDARTWLLPETKNQRAHVIHLSDFALAQMTTLLSMREIGPDGKPVAWVFPNTACTGPVCIKSFGKQLADRQRPPDRRLKNRTKKTDALILTGGRWTAHDLRRTAATLMAGLGISTDVIDECLNHKLQSKVARVYIKDRRLGEQARAFDALGAHLEAVFAGKEPDSNVVTIKRRARAAA